MITVANNVVTLSSDGIGYDEGVLTIANPVSSCQTWVFYGRWWVDSISSTSYDGNYHFFPWDKRHFLCFSYTSEFSATFRTTVFGLADSAMSYPTPGNVTTYLSYGNLLSGSNSSTNKLPISSISNNQPPSFFIGSGESNYTNSLGSYIPATYTPYTSSAGYLLTHVWKVDSVAGTKGVNVSVGINWENLSFSNITNALTSANTYWQYQNTNFINMLSTWKPGSITNQIIPPPYFMVRFPDIIARTVFKMSQFKVQYWL